MLPKDKRIEILNRQKDMLTGISSNYNIWLLETQNLFDKVFAFPDSKKEQLRQAIHQPGASIMGINIGQLTEDWKRLLESYIYEIGLEDEQSATLTIDGQFVHKERIAELKALSNTNFDYTRLIRMCEELNSNYSDGNFLSVAMLGRSIIDHVPPLFNYNSFNEVANNYGTSSFKKNMEHLNKSMRNIADMYLHQTIRKKESIPNQVQINFSRELDQLLGEIIRIN